MPTPHLYNFMSYNVPEDIETLLSLLGFWSVWDKNASHHRIYERELDNPRMRWRVQYFRGGTVKEWQAFLSQITAVEHVR